MPAKICPRCGAQYENLRSATCPQCFAHLLVIDDATAEELSAARAQVEQSQEFQEAKAADDEKFREQSFGACAGVLAIFVLTLVVAVVLLVQAHRHRPSVSQSHIGPATAVLPPPKFLGRAAAPTTLPVAGAALNDVLPEHLDLGTGNPAGLGRVSQNSDVVVPGTLTPVFHATYRLGDRNSTDVYAIPSGTPTDTQNGFRLGVALAARLEPPRSLEIFSTEHWLYAILAPPAPSPLSDPATVQDALLAHFRALGG